MKKMPATQDQLCCSCCCCRSLTQYLLPCCTRDSGICMWHKSAPTRHEFKACHPNCW